MYEVKDFRLVNRLNLEYSFDSDPLVQFLFIDDVLVGLAPFKSLVVYIWDAWDLSAQLYI